MKTSVYRIASIVGLALVLVLGALVPIAVAGDGSKTVHVSGTQTPLKNPVNFDVKGDLVGTWYTLSINYTTVKEPTLYVFTGNEKFVGCLDRRGDGRCGSHDLKGTLTFDYIAWQNNDKNGNLIKGQCTHPVTGGTGDFTGARGVINIYDTPVGNEVKSVYRGDIELNAVPAEAVTDAAHDTARVDTPTSTPVREMTHGCGRA